MIAPENKQLIAKVPLTEQLSQTEASALRRYQQKAVGDTRLAAFLRYELTTGLLGNLSGALGYLLRKQFYPGLFRQVGSGVIFGKGLILRHPRRISLGNRVAIDDYSLLDASGAGKAGVSLGSDVIVSRNCVIQGKTGAVVIQDRTDIGCNAMISSGGGIFIGQSVLIGGNCYIGGGRYLTDRLDIPMLQQGVYSKGPVVIEDDVWLGAGAIVLDGVRIGKGCIVGAGAVVTKNLPDYTVAVGVPAQPVKQRQFSPP